MKTTDLFWLNDPAIIINPNRFIEFIPSNNMTRVEQLNSLVRFCLYFSILLCLLKLDINYMLIFLTSLVLTYIIYNYDINVKNSENLEKFDVFKTVDKTKKCLNYVKPSYDNPFMNPTLLDINGNPNREAYSKRSFLANDEIKQDMEDKFSYNLYQDADDIFSTRNSRRQFYTVPSTTIPNSQDDFAKWLYGNPPSCKDGNGLQCDLNNSRDLSGESRPVFY
jgi:hypothetical protein